VPSSNTVACDTTPTQFQIFGTTQESLPKNSETYEGRTAEEWNDIYLKSCEDLANKLLEVRAMRANQQINVDSVSTANSAKAGLDKSCAKSNQQKMIDTSTTTDLVQAKLNFGKSKSDTQTEFVKTVDKSFVEQEHGECETTVLDFSGCKGPFMLPYEFRAKEIDEHQQEESIAEPSSVEEERRHEETEDPEKKEDMTFENLKAEQENVQMKSTRGKDVVIDDNAPPKMIRTKDPEVGVSNVSEIKTKSARRSKPTDKQLFSRRINNCWTHILHARPITCLVGLEIISILGPLLDMEVMNAGEVNHMYGSRILQKSRHIGAMHLLCIRNFLRGAVITGSHIIQSQ
jgi:hypothetical protein